MLMHTYVSFFQLIHSVNTEKYDLRHNASRWTIFYIAHLTLLYKLIWRPISRLSVNEQTQTISVCHRHIEDCFKREASYNVSSIWTCFVRSKYKFFLSLWSSKFLSLHDSLHDFSILKTTKLIMRIVYQYAKKQMAGQILKNCYKCCLVHMMRHISTRWGFTESTLRLQNVFFFFRCWNPE